MSPLLEFSRVSQEYAAASALRKLDLTLERGETHAVVGEHRSGKSSIARILGGAAAPTSGEVRIEGRGMRKFTPAYCLRKGIGAIQQETALIPSFSAVENIFAGRFLMGRLGLVQIRRMEQEVERYVGELGLEIDLKKKVRFMPADMQFKVELVRAVFFEPRILVLDEIGTKFNSPEMDLVLGLLKRLKAGGTGILYITNNMDEVFEVADRVSILKGGRIVRTDRREDLDRIKLIDMTYSFEGTRMELRQRNIEIYNYMKYNEDIIRNLPTGVLILDEKNNLYLQNFRAAEILQSESAPATLSMLLDRMPREFQQDFLHHLFRKEACSWEEVAWDEYIKLKITMFPFRDIKKRQLGTILILEDISRDVFLKQYLIQTEKIASVAELAAGVAHEVNNPLGIILNYVELLKMRHEDDYSRERLGKIESELNRIKSLIGTLLSFSHPGEHPRKMLRVSDVLAEVVALLSHEQKKRNISISQDYPGEADDIASANEVQLKQVFLNLLINAMEAVGADGGITVSAACKDGAVEVLIRDSGPGIPEEILDSIFNPFYTTKGAGNTGLGLSICRHIVEAHQGLLTCSNDREGAVFIIRLPAAG